MAKKITIDGMTITLKEAMAEYNQLSEKEKAYWDGYAACLNENCK